MILILTGIGFAIWARFESGRHHHENQEALIPGVQNPHSWQEQVDPGPNPSLARRFAAIAVPFGAAASPDLTVLPVALAASAIGVATVIAVLVSFSLVTLSTFVVLTVGATLAGYQVKGEWLENYGSLITAAVLIAIGIAVYFGV